MQPLDLWQMPQTLRAIEAGLKKAKRDRFFKKFSKDLDRVAKHVKAASKELNALSIKSDKEPMMMDPVYSR